jgi:serine protease Do
MKVVNVLVLPVAVLLAVTFAPMSGFPQEVPRLSNLDLARMLNEAFVEVAGKVSPTVVIITVVERPATAKSDDSKDKDDSDSREFWRRSYGQGSGVIIREDGYILTNRHVVEDAERIQVRLQDGHTYRGNVRGVDAASDVAVIKIEAKGLPVARLADSSRTRVGEFAIAVGAPFGLDYSVTYGHVSAKGRSNIIMPYEGGALMDQDFIQTDASINPGNSGGPLVNLEGEVIGINTLIRGMRTGIGFAIPSSLAREVSDQLIAHGKFTRAWLGIEIRSLREEPDLREWVRGTQEGVLVAGIRPDGPAAKSDLRYRDVITAVNGRQVNTAQELRAEIRGQPVGQPLTLDVVRRGKATQVQVSPGEWSPPTPVVVRTERTPDFAPTKLGVTVHPLTRELARQLGLDITEGVIVLTVEKGTAAEKQGLRSGDVIVALNDTPTTSTEKFQKTLDAVDLKKGVRVKIQRGDKESTVVVKE